MGLLKPIIQSAEEAARHVIKLRGRNAYWSRMGVTPDITKAMKYKTRAHAEQVLGRLGGDSADTLEVMKYLDDAQ